MKKLIYLLLLTPIIYLSSCSKSNSTEDYAGYNCVDGSCLGVFTNPQYLSLNSCDSLCASIFGCTDPLAINFNPLANTDDSSCIYPFYVNVYIGLNLPEYSDLQISGSSIFIEGGVEGIIIYHGIGNDYKVYDRNCSYEPSLSCSVIDSVNSGIAFCGCCTSAFLISNTGEALNAPALLPLKTYNWSLNGSNVMHIYN
ncbi:MAG: hypothetical protein HOL74_01660 [Flavobacteriales bacterium]|nr:hypothetical protein [Flavobacteriales bacterium]